MTSTWSQSAKEVLRGAEQIVATELCMLDIVMLAIGVVFFALSIAYVYACDLL